MKDFNENNLKAIWSDSIEGKLCYVSNSLKDLIDSVVFELDDSTPLVLKTNKVEQSNIDNGFMVETDGLYQNFIYCYVCDEDLDFIEEFDKNNVFVEWDDSLIGKKCLLSDRLYRIKEMLEGIIEPVYGTVTAGSDRAYPFFDGDNSYIFCYLLRENKDIVTRRQLSKWLAEGNGEFKCDGWWHTSISYNDDNADEKVENIQVRKWSDEKPSAPTVQYLFGG